MQRHLAPTPIILPSWDRQCPHCGASFLSTEGNSFCCADGRQMVPSLQLLSPHMQQPLHNPLQRQHVVENARTIDNIFSFAGIGVSGSLFTSTAGPPAVAITGRTYHLVRDTECTEHSIHWFLYDKTALQRKTIDLASTVQSFRSSKTTFDNAIRMLDTCNICPRGILEIQDYSSPGRMPESGKKEAHGHIPPLLAYLCN